MTPHTDTVHRSQMQLKHKKKKNTFRTMKGLTLPSVHPNGQRILNKERLFESDKRTMDKKEASFPFFPFFFFFFFTPQLISLHSHFSLPQQHTHTYIQWLLLRYDDRQSSSLFLTHSSTTPYSQHIQLSHSALQCILPFCITNKKQLYFAQNETTIC